VAPSARRASVSAPALRLAAALLCAALLCGVASGCSTTQEKAAAQQAHAKRVLERRAKRQRQRAAHKHRKESEKG